jgi:uncharacterized protein
MLIGVLSDTHIPSRAPGLPHRLLESLRGVDLILHAGDITTLSVLQRLSIIAPLEAVSGNVDSPDVVAALPRSRVLELEGKRVGLVHGDGTGSSTLARAQRAFTGLELDVIVFGHSHSAYCQWHDKTLMFNPGSPTDKRRAPRPSYGLLRLGDTIEGEIIYL